MDGAVSDGDAIDLHLPGYRDVVRLGEHGFSTWYRATSDRFGRPVAVKVLAMELGDATSQQSFLREATLVGPLSEHPNIVDVLDAGFTELGRPYLACEYMAHGSVGDRLARDGPLPVPDVLHLGVKIAGAVAAIHAIGVMHRDIKPENILLSHFDEPGLADFGIATVLAGRTVTSGTFAATPVHAPPEVIEGHGSRAPSDLWSLGSTLHTLLAGRPPFAGERGEGLYPMLQRILAEPAPPVPRAEVPTSVQDALALSLAKDPADRYPDAVTFGRVLQAAQDDLGLPVTDMVAPAREPTATPRAGASTLRRRDTVVLEVSGIAELRAARASGEFTVPARGARTIVKATPIAPVQPAPPAPPAPVAPVPPVPSAPAAAEPVPVVAPAPAAPVVPPNGSRTTVPPVVPVAPPAPAAPVAPVPPPVAPPPAPSEPPPAPVTRPSVPPAIVLRRRETHGRRNAALFAVGALVLALVVLALVLVR